MKAFWAGLLLLATASECRAARLAVRVLSEPRGTVWSISFSSDASLVAAASDVTASPGPGGALAPRSFYGSQVRVWETETGRVVLALGFEARVKACALSPDGKTLAAGTTEGIVLHEVPGGARRQAFSGDAGPIDALAYSRDGRLLVSQSSREGGGVLRVRTAEGRPVSSFSEPGAAFSGFSLSADGKLLAAAAGGQIKVWDVASGGLKRTVRLQQEEVRSAVLSPDGKTLAVPVVFELKLWDAKTGKPSGVVHEFFTDLLFSGDGRGLAGLLNESVSVVDARTWATKKTVEMGSVASSFALSDDASLLATGHGGPGEGPVRLWDMSAVKDQPLGRGPSASGPSLPSFRAFSCDSLKVTADAPLKAVDDGEGDQLLLRPTAEPCRYDLIYKEAAGKESVVSRAPGMYIVVAVRRFKSAKTSLVCASNIAHSRFAANPGKNPRALIRRIDAAPIDCAALVDGRWGPAARVLSGGASWAAWATGLSAAAGQAGGFKLRFIRDSTFQFTNTSDQPRTPKDGVYETVLTVERGKAPKAGAVTKVSDKIEAVEVKGL